MNDKSIGTPQITPHEPEHTGSQRDPEERPTKHVSEAKEKSLDKTLADSFPTSDPPSSIPDPVEGTDSEVWSSTVHDHLAQLPAGSWAAISLAEDRVISTGTTRHEAENAAREQGHSNMSLIRVAEEAA